MARKEIQRNRLADGDVMLKVQFALAANKLDYWKRSIIIL